MSEHSIFVAALDIADPVARSAYLDQACAGDPTLRQQVDALLAAHERSGEFLDVPALKQMAAERAAAATSAEHEAAQGEVNLSFLEPPTAPGMLGRLGHYAVREVVGRGGCGIVLKAFDERLERVVAIKVMAPELAATSPARKRFLREARATAQVRHANVVSIYAVEEQPLPFLVMEYIEGTTLQQKLDQTGPLDVHDVLRIGQQIASGLAAAHDKGLIHRDIKPGNILLEEGTGHLKITDFGLARSADDASMTQSGLIAGTPLYMSPEQAQAHDIDQRSDLFSLGSVLYVMCSGRPPFRAATTLAVIKRVVEDQPRPIQAVIPEVPDWLVAIITILHAKDPRNRFASAQQVGDLLDNCLAQLEQQGRVQLPEEILAMLPPPASQAEESAGVGNAGENLPASEDRSVCAPVRKPSRSRTPTWAAVAAATLVLLAGLSITEATGVTNVRGTVIRLFSPDGTLVVEVDDPGVSVSIDGEEMVITGTGAKEIRLKPGEYRLLASKDGKVVQQELVTVTRNGRQVVRVSREAEPVDPQDDQASKSAPKENEYNLLSLVDLSKDVGTGTWKWNGAELVLSGGKGFSVLEFPYRPGSEYDVEIEFTRLGRSKGLIAIVLTHGGRMFKWNVGMTNPDRIGFDNVDGRILQGIPESRRPQYAILNNWRYVTRVEVRADRVVGYLQDLPPIELKTDYSNLSIVPEARLRDGAAIGLAFWAEDVVVHRAVVREVTGIGHLTRPTDAVRMAREPVSNPDRGAAQWVLSVGGTVRGAAEPGRLITAGDPLPPGEWKLIMANVTGNPRATDTELAVFENCRHLSALYLSETPVTDAGLTYFKDSKNLLTLELAHTAVTDKGLAVFKDHQRLEQLNLIGTQVTDQGLLLLGNRNAYRLLLANTSVGDAGVAVFKDSQKLITLDLSGTRVTAAGLAHFGGCPKLQHIHLNGLPIGDSAVAIFKDCAELAGLRLNGTQVSDAGLEFVTKMKSRGVVGLRQTKVTAAGVQKLAAARPDLRIEWDGGVIQPTAVPDAKRQDPVASQADAVRQELRRSNPDFQGVITFLVEGGQVVRWSIVDGTLADLSPLLDLQHLKELHYAAFDPERDAPVVRQLARLEKINGDSAASFRLAYPANKPPPGVSDQWLATVARLPVKSRVPVVMEKLQEQNPNFDGKYAFRDSDWFLTFDSRAITDLSPLKALPELRQFVCSIPFPNRSWLTDLSPLSGMSLTRLECERTRVADVSPLKGMPLTKLDLTGTPVSDLTPLKGMPLAWFDLVGTRVENLAPLAGMRLTRFDLGGVPVADLSPLKGMPLEYLDIASSKVEDLSPLQGAPLRYLNCWGTQVSDLAPLKGMPLKELYCFGTQVADLSPLKGMQLTRLECGHSRVSDLSPLRGMALRQLNVRETEVADLSPLAGTALIELYCANSSISDLSPLKGLRLTHLEVNRTTVSDLSPLKEMPLESLWIPDVSAENLQIIRSIASLKQINGKPAADFWKAKAGP